MDYLVLWILSFIFLIIYASLGVVILLRYRKILDSFIKSSISIYICAFIVKPFFWLACWALQYYNQKAYDTSKPLVPTRSTLGSLISGMCFLILHIFLFRIIVAYYLLKLGNHVDRQVQTTNKIQKLMQLHIVVYVGVVVLKATLDFINDRRLDEEYRFICQRLTRFEGSSIQFS